MVRMQRLGDQRTRRDEVERVAVGRRASRPRAPAMTKLPPGLFSTSTVVLHVLAHLLRDQPRRDVGAAAGRKADDHADRLARKILRLSRRERGQRAGEQQAPPEPMLRRKDRHRVLPESVYGLMFASLVILV